MSYEGYSQYLCSNGHLRQYDCYADINMETDKCSCGAEFVFLHCVDQTNGDELDDPSTPLTTP